MDKYDGGDSHVHAETSKPIVIWTLYKYSISITLHISGIIYHRYSITF
jgi:hypothetical protein